MKKIFISAMIMFGFVASCFAGPVTAKWDHAGGNTDGFYVYWKPSAAPDWVFNIHIEDGDARQMVLADEVYFQPGVEYTFVGVAHSNTLGDSAPSLVTKWTRPVGTFPWAPDHLPTVIFASPSATTPPLVKP